MLTRGLPYTNPFFMLPDGYIYVKDDQTGASDQCAVVFEVIYGLNQTDPGISLLFQ